MSNYSKNANAWRSANLIYRACETPEDDEFFFEMAGHAEDFMNYDTALPRPQSRKDVKEYQDMITTKALMVVMICLPPDPSNPPGQDSATGKVVDRSTEDVVTHEQKAEPKQQQTNTSTPRAKLPVPVGVLDLSALEAKDARHRKCNIGINIAQAYQGKGYGSEAIRWALDFGFTVAGLHRMGIAAFEWNEGACRLYRKLGFKEEGRIRDAFWHDGRFWDEMCFGMLEDEWRAMKGRKVGEVVPRSSGL